MGRLHRILNHPQIYGLKSLICGLGRKNVQRYLREQALTGRVLDVGCGTGRHAAVIPGAYWGVDADPDYIAYAQSTQSGHFQVMDATQLAFPDGYFDAVFCSGLCHHLTDDQVLACIREMQRVLKTKGRLLVIDGVYPARWNLLGNLLFRWDRGGHMRSLDTMTAVMESAGLQRVQQNIPGSFPYQRAVFGQNNYK